MKTKIFIPAIAIILMTFYGCSKIEREHDEADNIEIKVIDFSKIEPGE